MSDAQASGAAGDSGDGTEATQPGAKVPEGVTVAGIQQSADAELIENVRIVDGVGGLPEGTLRFTPENDVAAPPLDAAETLGAESDQTSKAPLVTTSAESTVGGVEASDSEKAGPSTELAGEERGPVADVVNPLPAPPVPDRRVAGADRRVVECKFEGDDERRKIQRRDENSPARETPEDPSSPPADHADSSAPDSPPAGDKLAVDHVHIPMFLRKSQEGPTPDPIEVTRTGFDQLSPPEDTELVRVWRVADPTRWFWARQVDSFLAPTLVWERNAYMLTAYPNAKVLDADELRDLA